MEKVTFYIKGISGMLAGIAVGMASGLLIKKVNIAY